MNNDYMPTDDQSEQFVVVDRNDNILEYRSRSDCHADKILIHRSVFVVIFNDKDEILMQKRSKHKDTYPGYYTVTASGHVMKGESYKTTAQREMKEETGILIPLKFIKTFFSVLPNETEMVAVFTGKYYSSEFKPDPSEVEEISFYSKEKIKEMSSKLTPGCINCLSEMNIL